MSSSDDFLGTPIAVTVVSGEWRGQWKRGPWGSVFAWDPETQDYTIIVKEGRPPLTSARMAPMPQPDRKRPATGCLHPDDRKYITVRDGHEKVRCRECRRLEMQALRRRRAA